MCKMVQSSRWLLQLVLLCQLWQLGTPCFGGPEHRSMGIHQENAGQIALFLLVVVICEIGKRLFKDYKCPVYCDINHKHYFREKDEEKYEQESNLQAVDGLHRPAGDASKEQSAGSL